MRIDKVCLVSAALVFVYAFPCDGVGQADKDQRCGASGFVLTYDRGAERWRAGPEKCDHPEMGPYSGALHEGDQKCGPTDHVLEYDKGSDSWKPLPIECAKEGKN
jgi:hypothetical protein